MQNYYDVVIIGAGVIGSSIARELSRYQAKVAVLEKEADVCFGNSSRNTGLLHAGLLYKKGSLKAKYSVEGNRIFDEIAKELDVPFKRTGKLIVGFTEEQRVRLIALKEKGEENGVPGMEMLDQEEIRKIDPNVGGNFALHVPTSGITCPYQYTIAIAENAVMNGVDYHLENEVVEVKKDSEGIYEITTSRGKYHSKWIINCAGLYAPEVAVKLGSSGHHLKMVKGEYIILDKKAGKYLNVPVYPCPDENGVFDIHVTPTIDGNVLVGPTCDEVVTTPYFDTTREATGKLMRDGSQLFDRVKTEWFIRSFAGIFPRLIDSETGEEKDFTIEFSEDRPNIINLLGMNSPGLTSAYPISKDVVRIIVEKEEYPENENFNPHRKGIEKFAELDVEDRKKLIEENPDYGEIICRCEQITKAEILESLNSPLKISSVNSIKYRTRATMGRCQGGYCETRITAILQDHLGMEKTDIKLDSGNSNMFTGEVRNADHK